MSAAGVLAMHASGSSTKSGDQLRNAREVSEHRRASPPPHENEWDPDCEPPRLPCGTHVERGLRAENQDAVFVSGSAAGACAVTGVFDGHGSRGAACARTAADWLRRSLQSADSDVVAALMRGGEADEAQAEAGARRAFAALQAHMVRRTAQADSSFNARFSGSTATVAVVANGRLLVANVGDSDAVLGKSAPDDADARPEAETLTRRHQLCDDEECARVLASGARVEPQLTRDGVSAGGPLRIWLPDIRTPGLMVSRSLGDTVCQEIGVSAEPSVTVRALRACDRVLVLGSDGLWEHVPAAEAVAVAEDLDCPHEAARALAHLALSRQERATADNVSVAVVHLEPRDARRQRLERQTDFEARRAARRRDARAWEATARENDRSQRSSSASSAAAGAQQQQQQQQQRVSGPGRGLYGSIVYMGSGSGSVPVLDVASAPPASERIRPRADSAPADGEDVPPARRRERASPSAMCALQ